MDKRHLWIGVICDRGTRRGSNHWLCSMPPQIIQYACHIICATDHNCWQDCSCEVKRKASSLDIVNRRMCWNLGLSCLYNHINSLGRIRTSYFAGKFLFKELYDTTCLWKWGHESCGVFREARAPQERQNIVQRLQDARATFHELSTEKCGNNSAACAWGSSENH